jgi:hypothetical protein
MSPTPLSATTLQQRNTPRYFPIGKPNLAATRPQHKPQRPQHH